MSYTISDVKNDLTGLLRGTSTNKITALTNLLNRAARECLADVDFAETRRKAQITNALYDQVYDYICPTDLKGDKIIDLTPQVNRGQKFTKRYFEEFDFDKVSPTLQVNSNSGTKSLRVAVDLTSGKTLHEMNDLTNNGTWTATASATNLTVDSEYYVSGSASLNFDLSTSGSTGYIENSTLTTVDLSDEEDIGSLFVWVYIPDTTIITSFTLRWGSSSANYWSSTVTTAHDGAFVNGWNLLRFDWNGATETGTGDASVIDYLRFTVAYDGTTETDLRVDNIVCRLGTIFDLHYYSKYLFKSSSGTWKENTDDDTDILNLDTDSYNIYLHKVAELCGQQIEMKKDDTAYFKSEYEKGILRYKTAYKSEVKKVKTTYYNIFKR